MKPKIIFLIVLGAGLIGVLIAFAFMQMQSSDTVEIGQDGSFVDASKPLISDRPSDEDVMQDSLSDREREGRVSDISGSDVEKQMPVVEEAKKIEKTPVLEKDANTIAERLQNERVNHYYNQALAYGMLIPYNTYYSGFGSSDGATHSIGFSRESIPETLADAEVRLYFFGKKALPELTNSTFFQDATSNTTYLKVDNEYFVRIEASSIDDATVAMIIETIYSGPNQEPQSTGTDETESE